MFTVNYHMEEQLRTQRMADCLRRSELDCMCREAGIDRRGWSGRQACRMLAALGLWLVKMGRRLEAVNLSPATGAGELRHNI